jgi:putative ABC transport system permease protein
VTGPLGLLRRLIARRGAESRMNHEVRLHLELEAEELARTKGLTPDEARRQALISFGGVELHKEALRDGRGLAWLDRFSLDLKLGSRLLVRHPLLTLVATVAMAYGIAAGVAAFEVRRQFVSPTLPLDSGSRIVGLRTWDAARVRPVPPDVDDFRTWREQLGQIDDVSAARIFERNLLTDDGRSEVVAVAAMSASAFRVARTPPLVGRTLLDADEQTGAPPVVVIGHRIWRDRFGGSPDAIGRALRLGTEPATIVGVMPDGFVFPASHDVWTPLRITADSPTAAAPQPLLVFGRLADGASAIQVETELNVIDARAPQAPSAARDHQRREVVPFAWLFIDPAGLRTGLDIGNGFVLLLLGLLSANVALLVFARTASRDTEIAVRSALGAARLRIVGQLFVEGLVLAALAAGVGLIAARFSLGWLIDVVERDTGRQLPFWVSDALHPATVIYAIGLTLVCATIIGVIPALKVTRQGWQARLRESKAGGFAFSGIWTVVIAVQVAVTLLFPAAAFLFNRAVATGLTRDLGFPSESYLAARLAFDREDVGGTDAAAADETFRAHVRATYTELERRLLAEPAVAGLTFADRLPGMQHARWRIEIEDDGRAEASAPRQIIGSASVATTFFSVLGAPILSGRNFTDADAGSSVAIVNQSLVRTVFGGRNPIGQRIRRQPAGASARPGPWLDIIGVVPDVGMVADNGPGGTDGLYQPVAPEHAPAIRLAIGVRGSPASFARRLQTVASEVSPTLRVHDIMSLEAAGIEQWNESGYLSRILTVMSVIALLLSLSTIYSVLSFTVSRRTREIGVRVALGADRYRVIGVILRRPVAQVGLGTVLGAALIFLTFTGLQEAAPDPVEATVLAVYAMVMMGVCLLACVAPTRRALAVDPADALRSET